MGDIDRQHLAFGRLRFPTGGIGAWRALRTDAGRWGDWPPSLEGGHLGETTVGAALEALASMNDAQGEIEITEEGEAATVCGFLLEPGTSAWSRDLAALLRVASEAGAKGEVVLLQVDGRAGTRIRVAADRSTVEAIDEEAATSLLSSPAASAALALYVAAQGGRTAGAPEQRSRIAANIHATIRDRLRERLGRVPEGELHRLALGQMLVCTSPAKWTPAAELFARPEQARAFYSTLDTDPAVESGFNLLARVAPVAAHDLAMEIVRSAHDGPMAVVSCALLGGSPEPEALAALLDYAAPVAGPWPRILQADVTTALGASTAPDAAKLILDRLNVLEGREEAAEGVLRLARALHDRSALDDATRGRLFGRFPSLLWLTPARPPRRKASPPKATAPRARAQGSPAAKAPTAKTRAAKTPGRKT